jgi:protein-L-isoaspartate(D-aspartate) O-methyltransferase
MGIVKKAAYLSLFMERTDWQKLIDHLQKQKVLRTPKVVAAMRNVPRTKFLPAEKQEYNSDDAPLPIGFGQTVSAPHIVSIMNEALQFEVGNKVLEIGAGSGWQAATIAELITDKEAPRSEWGHIYAMEIVQALAEQAKKNIMNAGYGDKVTIINGEGSEGYPEKAPFDRIVVTASAQDVPAPLLEQLKSGGIMVIPIGKAPLFQNLMKITKNADGKVRRENLGGVSFAPLTGKYSQNL